MDIIRILEEEEPFFKLLGLRLLELRRGYSKLELPYREEFTRRGKVIQGGIIFSAMDFAGAIATMTVNDGEDQVTQELKVSFLEPMFKGPFIVEGNVIRRGGSTVVVKTTFTDSEGKLGAIGLGTWILHKNKRVTK
ncbi:MAG: PaaI family thioesterase [Sulfolobaceae archaeon]|nr:PaaI family thioesterase [Sulfolobaceae archaeon]